MTSSVNRVPQLYGYSVCLVALLTALFSITSIINNVFRLSNPIYAEERWAPFGASLDSFEAYKATYQREPVYRGTSEPTPADTLSEAGLRRRYDALRAERIATGRFAAQRGLTSSFIMFFISVGLFIVHWRWLKRRVEPRDQSA